MINVVLWCITGGVSGFMASRLSRSPLTRSLLVYLVGGWLGALIGGTLFTIFDTTPLATLSLSGLGAALLGALVVLGLVQMMMLRIQQLDTHTHPEHPPVERTDSPPRR